MIYDSRQMFATTAAALHQDGFLDHAMLSEPSHVEAFWEAHAAARRARGLPPYPEAPQQTRGVRSHEALRAYVSDGRWVAQCTGGPTGKCAGGLACWPEHDTACCLDCGTIYKVEFPSAAEIVEAAAVLMGRPQGNRNWRPGEETPKQLREENVAHGAPPEQTWQQKLADEHGVTVEQVEAILKAKRR